VRLLADVNAPPVPELSQEKHQTSPTVPRIRRRHHGGPISFVGSAWTSDFAADASPRQRLRRVHFSRNLKRARIIERPACKHLPALKGFYSPPYGRSASWTEVVFDRVPAFSNSRERSNVSAKLFEFGAIDHYRNAVGTSGPFLARVAVAKLSIKIAADAKAHRAARTSAR
jgi:hypothetical protein